jgi:hypothetical protein
MGAGGMDKVCVVARPPRKQHDTWTYGNNGQLENVYHLWQAESIHGSCQHRSPDHFNLGTWGVSSTLWLSAAISSLSRPIKRATWTGALHRISQRHAAGGRKNAEQQISGCARTLRLCIQTLRLCKSARAPSVFFAVASQTRTLNSLHCAHFSKPVFARKPKPPGRTPLNPHSLRGGGSRLSVF